MQTGSGSEFRQLWPFLPGAEERLRQAVQSQRMTDDEAAQIRAFADKGYLILPRAIERELVAALVRDIRSIGQHPGAFVITDHRHGRAQTYSGADFDTYESIFDTYVNFESARRVCFHPRIVRFLEHIFETPPIATQQLLFQRSNGHPVHQDTSVVCTEEPLLLVATWIALEDVVPGRGELTYYEGSHKIPHQIYSDGSKRLNPQVDDVEASRRRILQECERLGCAKKDFFAKTGDVLFWAADLVHASNPRSRPETETRMSVVTHYCPETTEPFWFRFHPDNRNYQSFDDARAKYASMYYRLPVVEPFARPNYKIPS